MGAARKKLHNPFPREPANIGFVKGELFSNVKVLPTQSFSAGRGFIMKWQAADNGGSLSVYHRSECDRTLWSTAPGTAFISGALANDFVEESRGSFSVHDKADLVCSHQTVEHIQVIWPQSTNPAQHFAYDYAHPTRNSVIQDKADAFFQLQDVGLTEDDGDGHKNVVEGPAVMVTGCLYTEPKAAAAQLKSYLETRDDELGPFYDTGACLYQRNNQVVGVRYWLFFSEKRDHHLGFSLELDGPVMQADSHSCTICEQIIDPLPLEIKSQISRCGRECGLLQSIVKNGYDSAVEYRNRLLCLWSERSLSALGEVGPSSISRRPMKALKRLFVGDMFVLKTNLSMLSGPGRTNFLSENSEESKPTDMIVNRTQQGLRKLNRVLLTYSMEKDERFFGFGEQFSYFDLKGKRIPIIVQEQGLGRGDQPITAAVNLVANRSGGDWHTTYAPVPYYITSSSRCLFLEGYCYSVFDLRTSDKVQVQVHANAVQGRILHGRTPLELIERYTEATGRMRELPTWIMEGAVVGMQGGTERVRNVWEQLQKADVPISAFWLQDWVGQRKTSIGLQLWWNWELDQEHYSGWCQLVQDLRAKGIRTMTYLNPFLASTDEKSNRKRDLFEEAKGNGYLIQNRTGSPYMIPNTSFAAAIVDLTNPEVCTWLKGIMHDMVKTGVRGWMADFGESLPFDASLFSDEDPASAHNSYPELWAKLNREFVDEWEAEQQSLRSKSQLNCSSPEQGGLEAEDDESLVFFMRAGYKNSPRWATLFWEGDQMVSWQRHDGIKSAVVGLLSSGLCGYAFNHSDIGGYCTVSLPFLRYQRSEELLMRWMELNAFTTIFRTHEGNIPSANHQFYSSKKSLLHFARFAKVYKAWEFYRKQLVKEAAATGWPIVRHLFLHYPQDKYAMRITYEQFLVGSEFLVVPVLDKGRRQVEAYFPAGEEWQHIWSGRIYGPFNSLGNLGSKVRIDSPLGYPAVFVRRNSNIGALFVNNLKDLGLSDLEEI